MKRSSNITPLALVSTLSFLIAASFSWADIKRDLFPINSEAVVGKASLPDPLRVYDSMIDADIAQRSPVKVTSGCATIEPWQAVPIKREQWVAINGNVLLNTARAGILTLSSSQTCIKPGYPFRVVEINPKNGASFDFGWFFPTAIHRSRASDAQIKLIEDELLLQTDLTNRDDAIFVSGRVIADQGEPIGPYVEGARIINREQMESAIKDGTPVVDVRHPASFRAFRIKGSISVPYALGKKLDWRDGYKDFAPAGDLFDVRLVPQSKESPVVIVGHYMSIEPIRTAVVLRELGWKKIFIFWEGIEYFTGMVWSPPAVSQLIRIIDANKVQRLLSDRTIQPVLLDVRSPDLFAKQHIAGSRSAPFYERNDVYLRTQGLNGQILSDYGEGYDLPASLNSGSTVVIVGAGPSDWSAYKAALLVTSTGHGTAMWYRGGMLEWNQLTKGFPQTFPVKSGAEK